MYPHQLSLLGGCPIYRSGLTTTILSRFPQIALAKGDASPPPDVMASAQRLILYVEPEHPCRASAEQFRVLLETCRKVGGRLIVFGPFIALKRCKRLLASGVRGYLLKETTEAEMARVVRGVLEGRTLVDAKLKALWVDEQLCPAESRFSIKITKREQQVLQLIVEERTTQEIADELFISHCTVESHRANIMGKLGVRNVAGLVREAVRRDLCEVA